MGKNKFIVLIWAVLLVLILYLGITLIHLRTSITEARADRDSKASAVEQLTQENEQLSQDIEHSEDPNTIEDIARDKLGLVYPDEKVYDDTGN